MAGAVGTAVPIAGRLRHRIGGLLGRPRREHILRQVPRGGVCAEIGVFRGRFTKHILAITQPSRMHLIDGWWTLYGDRFPDWGGYTEHGRLTTRQAFAEVQEVIRGAGTGTQTQVHVGDDLTVLASFPDEYFDWVYLDSSHEFEQTYRELTALETKMKPSGLVLGDDWHDDATHIHGGVAQATRELCATNRWNLIIPGDRCGQWMIQRCPSAPLGVESPHTPGASKDRARRQGLGWRALRTGTGPLANWVIGAPVGTARYRFCLAALLARRGPTRLARIHILFAAFLAPVRDRVPYLRDKWRQVRLREPPHDVIWTAGPASDFDVLNEVLVLGEYDKLGLDAPKVIFDLGSHIGASILRLHAAYPEARIYGFEPDPMTFERLVRNTTQLQGVTVLPWAISDIIGQTPFSPRRQSWKSSIRSEGATSPISVESVTLDTALLRLGITNVDLIKIDIEGAEVAALRGFQRLNEVPMIVGELHGQSLCDEMLGILADFVVETQGHPDHCHFRARRSPRPPTLP